MPLNTYGVWKGKINNIRLPEPSTIEGVHLLHAYVDFENDTDHIPEVTQASINIYPGPSNTSVLVYWLIQDLEKKHRLEALPRGWNEIVQLANPDHRKISLDYIRAEIDHLESGEIIRETDHIADYLCPFIMNASKKDATAYIYGQLRQGSKTIHDVHMNQGSSGKFAGENGIRQDGGILFEFLDGH